MSPGPSPHGRLGVGFLGISMVVLPTFRELMWDLGRLSSDTGRDLWVERTSLLLGGLWQARGSCHLVDSCTSTYDNAANRVFFPWCPAVHRTILPPPRFTRPVIQPTVPRLESPDSRGTQRAGKCSFVLVAEHLGLLVNRVEGSWSSGLGMWSSW